MANWVSLRGKWFPCKEKVALKNLSDKPFEYKGEVLQPGDPFIYQGPDREAIKQLALEGLENLGTDFRRDPEFLQAVRTMGFTAGEQGVGDYLTFIGYDEEADEKKFNETASIVSKHDLPARNREILTLGGGRDMTGNKNADVIGGFGEEKVRPADELRKVAGGSKK